MTQVHPRIKKVVIAVCELEAMILQWQQRHGLTDIECLKTLIDCSSGYASDILRDERHPDDPNKKSSEA